MKTLCALVAAVLLLGAVPGAAFAASDRPHLSSDPRVNGARALIQGGRFDEALSVLRPLAPEHPDRTDVLFLLGLAAIKASQRPETPDAARTTLLDEAVAALRAVLVHRPGLVRVRLELARAFFLKGEDDLSRAHFERVLAGGPPAAMAANIHRFLNAMRARRRWSGRLGVAVAPDTNLNAASDTDILRISGLPFRRDADAGPGSGLGIILWGGGEYQHPLDEGLRLRAGADVARREYPGKDFDRTFLSAHLGPRWLADADTDFSLLASARRHWAAGEPESLELGARFEAVHRLTPRLTARGRASWHRRTYGQRPFLDGPVVALSVGGAWVVMPTMRADAALGYGRERPRSLRWRNATRWARLGVSVALPFGLTAGAGGELRWTAYEGRWFPFTPTGTSREDRTRILHVSAFHRALTLYGFSPQLALVGETRASNAQLYDYRRNRAELRLVRQF